MIQHEGGHTPFTVNITAALRPDQGEQVIVVRAEDHPQNLTQPRGKQHWEEKPRDIWYNRTIGIWQPVWLEPVPALYITEIRWTPDMERGQLGFRLKLNRAPDRRLVLHVHLSLRGKTIAEDIYIVERSELRRDIGLEAAQTIRSRDLIWSPRYPNLIDAVLTLRDGDTVIDEVRSYVGLRSVGFANGRFILNGSPYYLRLVLEQDFWPESHLAAPSPEALRREVELVKELGFNGVRIHQKVEDPRFLYWCDRLGVVVWGEMANAYVFSRTAIERFTKEWMEVLQRDYSHPCIVAWVPFNESWGVPNLERDRSQQNYVRAIYHLTRAFDPTRLVIGNDGWEHLVSDIFSIHDYAIDGATLRERYGTYEAVEQTIQKMQPQYRTLRLPDYPNHGEPIMLTEFGGIAYEPDPNKPWFGYGTVKDADEFLRRYEEIVSAILDSPVIAGFCYTQLTDVEQETNGLLTEKREYKLDPQTIYAITRRPSKAIPAEILSQIHQAAEVITFRESTTSPVKQQTAADEQTQQA